MNLRQYVIKYIYRRQIWKAMGLAALCTSLMLQGFIV